MEIITSIKNKLIIDTKKIKTEPNGCLFLESPKLIKEAYLAKLNFKYCLVSQEQYEKLIKEYPFLKLLQTIIVSKSIIDSLSDTKTPQGIIAIVEYKESVLKPPKGNFLVLDNLQDAGNVGTIIRSCKGTSFKDIYLINCVNYANQKVIRSAMGNIFDVNLYTFKNVKSFLEFAKLNNLNLAVADMQGQNLFNIANKPKNLGIVIGNEGNGVSNEIKTFANTKISIPMKNGLESLNAGVSCGIIIYYLDNLTN